MKVMVLWGHPSLTAGKLRGLWFLTLAPSGTQFALPVPPPSPSSWEDGICSPVTHFLSLWVEGGERGRVGSRVGGCGGVGRGKVTHFVLPSSSSSSLDTSQGAALPSRKICEQAPLILGPWLPWDPQWKAAFCPLFQKHG